VSGVDFGGEIGTTLQIVAQLSVGLPGSEKAALYHAMWPEALAGRRHQQ